jgi:hypothetical protein
MAFFLMLSLLALSPLTAAEDHAGGTLGPQSIMIMWEDRLSHFCISR